MMPDFEKFRANGTDYTVRDPNAIHDLSAYRTASAQDAIDATKADKPIIKNAMDSVASVNTQYFLGTQSAVSIVLPSNAAVGQEILVCFASGSTAATLACNLNGFNYRPSANKKCRITFTCMNSAGDWLVKVNEGR